MRSTHREPATKRPLNRRQFLYLTITATGGTILAACGGGGSQPGAQSSTQPTGSNPTPTTAPTATQAAAQSTKPAAPTQTGAAGGPAETKAPMATVSGRTTQGPASTSAVPSSFKESPQLSKLVQSGKLPEVSKRVGTEPKVLHPVEKIGQYGGDWNYGLLSNGCPECLLTRTIDYDGFVQWKADVRAFTPDEVVPNVAESFEVNKDGTEYTFKLREGMRWSDGQPFTTEDVMFWYEDYLMNKDLTPTFPDWLMASDKPVKVLGKDKHTVLFKFASPNGLFIQRMAMAMGTGVGLLPKHYMKQYHKKYNPKVVQEAKKQKMDHWMDLFLQKASAWNNNELPVMNAWVLNKPLGGDVRQLIAERNPYYFKVDPEGNQLPYLDRAVFFMAQEMDVMVLKALNGEIDLQSTYISDLTDKAVYYKQREKGNYHFVNVLSTYMNNTPINLNLTHKDPVKRKVFQDKNFRIGLSHAINRQEIIDVTLVSQGKPFQCAPRPESPFYNEKLATQYTEYDTKKANEYLDKVLPKKDSGGLRLGPDGKPFTFIVEVAGDKPPDDLTILQKHWQAVGIKTDIKATGWDLFWTRVNGNEHDAVKGYGDGGLDVIVDPRSYFPFSGFSVYAIPWANWYTHGGLQGKIPKKPDYPVEEPPEAAKQQMKLYEQIEATPDANEQVKLLKQILDIAVDQFWCMGISLPVGQYGIQKNDFHNVPKTVVSPGTGTTPAWPNASQYFSTKK